MRGCLSAHNYASEERFFTTVPKWRHLPLLHVIPKSALEAGYDNNANILQIYLIHQLIYLIC